MQTRRWRRQSGANSSLKWDDRLCGARCARREATDGEQLQHNSSLRLSTTAPFAFRYTSAATGSESWAFLPQLVAVFDEPRTVNDDRVRLAGPALIVLLQTSTSTLLFVEAVAPQSAQSSIESYCLKNLAG